MLLYPQVYPTLLFWPNICISPKFLVGGHPQGACVGSHMLSSMRTIDQKLKPRCLNQTEIAHATPRVHDLCVVCPRAKRCPNARLVVHGHQEHNYAGFGLQAPLHRLFRRVRHGVNAENSLRMELLSPTLCVYGSSQERKSVGLHDLRSTVIQSRFLPASVCMLFCMTSFAVCGRMSMPKAQSRTRLLNPKHVCLTLPHRR